MEIMEIMEILQILYNQLSICVIVLLSSYFVKHRRELAEAKEDFEAFKEKNNSLSYFNLLNKKPKNITELINLDKELRMKYVEIRNIQDSSIKIFITQYILQKLISLDNELKKMLNDHKD